jgi:curved DNA-binding protein CbpA
VAAATTGGPVARSTSLERDLLTLYDVLGVAADATGDELRAAYLARARRLHPDRLIDADPGERVRAEREMQALNEAWRVLGHPPRRREYDRRLAGAEGGEPAVPFEPGEPGEPGEPTADELGWVDPVTRIVRVLPWVMILLVLLAIFVFTAYAGGSGR